MKVLVCNQPGQFTYQEQEIPEEKEGYTLLKIKLIGICGTDYHAFEGTQPFFNYPRVLGHEIAAEIVSTQEETGFSIGEQVTVSPYLYCGHCVACRNGKSNCCQSMQVCGVHIDGGMAEYLSVPTYSLIHGAGLAPHELVLVEPLAIGAHGVKRADVQPGEFVLVIGAGPIGLATMDFARIAGGHVIAMDLNTTRLDYCKQAFGVEHTINPSTDNVLEKLAEITNGEMPTVVIDCSGNLLAINNSFQYMAHGARFVLIGLQKKEISFSHPEFHKREATLMSSRNALAADFDHVIACIKSKRVKPENYITHQLQLDEVKEQFANLAKPESGVIKAVIEF